jgi:hypothetical protein
MYIPFLGLRKNSANFPIPPSDKLSESLGSLHPFSSPHFLKALHLNRFVTKEYVIQITRGIRLLLRYDTGIVLGFPDIIYLGVERVRNSLKKNEHDEPTDEGKSQGSQFI